jgi:hypothetical protein
MSREVAFFVLGREEVATVSWIGGSVELCREGMGCLVSSRTRANWRAKTVEGRSAKLELVLALSAG